TWSPSLRAQARAAIRRPQPPAHPLACASRMPRGHQPCRVRSGSRAVPWILPRSTGPRMRAIMARYVAGENPMTQVRDGVHIRTCSLCEAMCGLEVTVEDGRVAKIRPNHDDVWSRGYICPKGTTLGDL